MKYTMKDFVEKPIAVRLKKENAESFLVACGKKEFHGIMEAL